MNSVICCWRLFTTLQVLQEELHWFVWEGSKWKAQCSLKGIMQPRIKFYFIHVDTDFFHFCYTELNTRDCASSCIYDIQIPYQSWWNVSVIHHLLFALKWQEKNILSALTASNHWKLLFTKQLISLLSQISCFSFIINLKSNLVRNFLLHFVYFPY